jgi:hypothetical protein
MKKESAQLASFMRLFMYWYERYKQILYNNTNTRDILLVAFSGASV